MADVLRRRWCLAPLTTTGRGIVGVNVRQTVPEDDPALAALLARAYAGTADDDPDEDYVQELRDWRAVDHADDEASFVAIEGRVPVSCCLIGFDFGAAFVYELATDPHHARRGLAWDLLRRSIDVLGSRGIEALWAWITDGNTASERLHARVGFQPVTPAVDAHSARLLYRAAAASGQIDDVDVVASGARVVPDGPELWLFGGTTEDHVVSHGVPVRVRSIGLDEPEARAVASTCMPVSNAALVLDLRLDRTR